MKIYTSYFYQVRFFKPYIVPLSTALWDPKWFHNFKGQHYIFKDKNGVYNGLRAEMFAPGPSCEGDCRGIEVCKIKDYKSCDFLKHYREQLNQLNIDDILKRCENIGNKIKEREHFVEEPIICFLVHEAPQNPCSERQVIQNWFNDNGVEVTEWIRSMAQ